MKFSREKEYLLFIKDVPEAIRVICNKVVKNTKGEVEKIYFEEVNLITSSLILKPEMIEDVIIPIDNTEFFIMYTNWMNFYRKGIHQDLNFANNLNQKIKNTFKERTYVLKGTGAFTPFDLQRLEILYQSSPIGAQIPVEILNSVVEDIKSMDKEELDIALQKSKSSSLAATIDTFNSIF